MTDKLQIIKQNKNVADIAKLCGWNSAIKNNMMRCPFHPDSEPSLSIYKDGTRYNCFACEAGGDAIDFYANYKGIDLKQAINELYSIFYGSAPPPTIPARQDLQQAQDKREEANPKTIKLAQNLLTNSTPLREITDTLNPAWLYLQKRGIDLYEHRRYISGMIRYKADIQLPLGITYQPNQHALVCGLCTEREVKAIMRIYFTADGLKNHAIFGKQTKRTLGQMGDSLIPVWEGFRAGSENLIITEGVEDALAYAKLWPQDPIASAGGLSRIRNIKIPARFTDITLAADIPTKTTHTKLMRDAVAAYAKQGKYARIEYPPDNCKDFNDYLIEANNG